MHGPGRTAALNSVTGLIFKRGLKLAPLLIDFMVRILLKFVASLPCLAMLQQPMEQLASQQTQKASEPKGASDVQSKNVSPLLEEIAELAYAGVKFSLMNGGLSTIEFCVRTAMLQLLVISIDMTSEIVLRNLVAYEASVRYKALIFARYVELMNGIIDTDKDAHVLRESGIIMNNLRSDREVTELWNRMTRSVRLTRAPPLDRVFDDLNKQYNSCWKVTVIFLFLFVILQAFLCLGAASFLGTGWPGERWYSVLGNIDKS